MSTSPKPSSPRSKPVRLSLADHRAKAIWRKVAWHHDSEEEQLRAAAQTVVSINTVLSEFHQEKEQDLAGYLWRL